MHFDTAVTELHRYIWIQVTFISLLRWTWDFGLWSTKPIHEDISCATSRRNLALLECLNLWSCHFRGICVSFMFLRFIYVRGFNKHTKPIQEGFCNTRFCSRYFSVVLASESLSSFWCILTVLSLRFANCTDFLICSLILTARNKISYHECSLPNAQSSRNTHWATAFLTAHTNWRTERLVKFPCTERT